MDLAPQGDLRAALIGRTILYLWPEDVSQRCTATRLCWRGTFLHVAAYTQQTLALCGTANMLLDASSYGVRWVLLSTAPGAGVVQPPDSTAPARCSDSPPRP